VWGGPPPRPPRDPVGAALRPATSAAAAC
jgi:hypothetical protein